jgi:hypothetical protein
MALNVYVNADTQDLALNSSGVDWVEFSEGNDQFIFTNGNTEVADGADIPTQAELISAGIRLDGIQIVMDTYLLQDTDVNELKDIVNMGNINKRYVVAFDFDGVTASEPVYEVYDDTNLNTATGTMLGGGTPSSSFIRGITTTAGLPGVNWITGATRMAGSGDGNFLYLNDQSGFLTEATTLYCNLCVVVPASQTTGFSANPVFVVKWLEN